LAGGGNLEAGDAAGPRVLVTSAAQAKGTWPPVKGFWSLTMYDEQMFLVANPIDRCSMSLRTNPVHDADGGLTIPIQHDSPGKNDEANWLPAHEGKSHLMLRLY